jgi:DNA-binding transcriptional ArsR family regulator
VAHPVRIRILEVLVRGERSVQELQDALGLGQPVVSQQLGVLRTSQIVVGRKQGVSVRYAVRDPLVGELLAVARRIFNNQLAGTRDSLRQLRDEHPPQMTQLTQIAQMKRRRTARARG